MFFVFSQIVESGGKRNTDRPRWISLSEATAAVWIIFEDTCRIADLACNEENVYDATERALLLRADGCLLMNSILYRWDSQLVMWLLAGKWAFSPNTWRILTGRITARSIVFSIQSSVYPRVMGGPGAYPRGHPAAGIHLELVTSASGFKFAAYFSLHVLLFMFRMELECQWNVEWCLKSSSSPRARALQDFSRISFTES